MLDVLQIAKISFGSKLLLHSIQIKVQIIFLTSFHSHNSVNDTNKNDESYRKKWLLDIYFVELFSKTTISFEEFFVSPGSLKENLF